MPDTPNFALPGLMEIDRPFLDSKRVLLNLAHKPLQDTLWPGIPSVGPVTPGGVQPTDPLAKVEMWFGTHFPVEDPPLLVLSSDDAGQLVITNPTTWTFSIPQQPLALPYGHYYWCIVTIDSSGNRSVFYAGEIIISD
jgi:hypothetical protein